MATTPVNSSNDLTANRVEDFFLQPWSPRLIPDTEKNAGLIRAIITLASIIITGGLALIFFAIKAIIDGIGTKSNNSTPTSSYDSITSSSDSTTSSSDSASESDIDHEEGNQELQEAMKALKGAKNYKALTSISNKNTEGFYFGKAFNDMKNPLIINMPALIELISELENKDEVKELEEEDGVSDNEEGKATQMKNNIALVLKEDPNAILKICGGEWSLQQFQSFYDKNKDTLVIRKILIDNNILRDNPDFLNQFEHLDNLFIVNHDQSISEEDNTKLSSEVLISFQENNSEDQLTVRTWDPKLRVAMDNLAKVHLFDSYTIKNYKEPLRIEFEKDFKDIKHPLIIIMSKLQRLIAPWEGNSQFPIRVENSIIDVLNENPNAIITIHEDFELKAFQTFYDKNNEVNIRKIIISNDLLRTNPGFLNQFEHLDNLFIVNHDKRKSEEDNEQLGLDVLASFEENNSEDQLTVRTWNFFKH